IVDERRLVAGERVGRAVELLLEDVAGEVTVARAQRRIALELPERLEGGERLVPALELDGVVEDGALRGAVRRIERDRRAIAGERGGRVMARVRALTGEKGDGRAVRRRCRAGIGRERLDAALGAVDVAVGEQALGLQPLHVAAIWRELGGMLERIGGERAIAGGPRRARDQQPALDR